MDPPRDTPWAEHEKVYLLAEILKAHPISSQMLFGIIRDAQIQPRWTDMALPPGRSLNSCQRAFQELFQSPSLGAYRQPTHPPLPPIRMAEQQISKKRDAPSEVTAPGGGRLIQPRPPHDFPANIMQGPAYTFAPVGEPATKRRRGRPTKAEAQAKAAAAEARGEIYPPPKPSKGDRPSSLLPREIAPQTPTAPLAPLPQVEMPMGLHMEASSETSSGKKRRGRPSKSDMEAQRSLEPGEDPSQFRSPVPGERPEEGLVSGPPPPRPPPPPTLGHPGGPVSAPQSRDPDVQMEGIEEIQQRTTTPHSFKETVGM